MGNLHEGHLSLIKKGKELGGQIITSIFINPLQFNNKKDLDNYPKTLNSDVQFLKRSCDLLLFFFKEEGGALGLCGEDNCNTHQVGGEGGPNAVFDLGGGVADVAFDRSIGLLG